MKTKAILFLGIIIILGVNESNAQVTYGVKGGLNFAKMVSKGGDIKYKYDSRTSIFIGGTAEFSVSEKVFVEPGLFISGKGGKENLGLGDFGIYKFSYLELPINLKYKSSISGGDVNAFGYAGPYFGFLMGGKYHEGNASVKVDGYKSLDVGLNIGVGVEMNSISLGIQYGIGVANIEKESGIETRNRAFSLSIGYRFGEQ